MTDLSGHTWDEAVEAGARALASATGDDEWMANLPGYAISEVVLAAAAPSTGRWLREQIATEIEAERASSIGDDSVEAVNQRAGLHVAARVVRGETR